MKRYDLTARRFCFSLKVLIEDLVENKLLQHHLLPMRFEVFISSQFLQHHPLTQLLKYVKSVLTSHILSLRTYIKTVRNTFPWQGLQIFRQVSYQGGPWEKLLIRCNLSTTFHFGMLSSILAASPLLIHPYLLHLFPQQHGEAGYVFTSFLKHETLRKKDLIVELWVLRSEGKDRSLLYHWHRACFLLRLACYMFIPVYL